MDIERPPNLRTPGTEPGPSTSPGGAGIGGPPPSINALAELVADLIAATGLVPADKLAQVRSSAGMGSLAHALVEQNVASSEGLARTLAVRYQMPLVDLALTGVSDEASGEIALHVLERLVAIPYALEDGTLKVAVGDPGNIQGIDELRLATRYPLDIGVAARDDIFVELRRLARASEAFGARAAAAEGELELLEEEEEETDDLEVDDGISDAPLVRLVNSVIFQAAEDGASDVHFEPQEDALLVRFRVDGVLHEVQRIPKRMMPGVLTRLKVLAKLDIAERRKPQDGRISLNAAAAGRTLDVRVATLPTVEGESIVMRLLDKSKKAPTLQELGMSDEMRGELELLIRKPTGALLVTGPTGSGKSTTLYAALTEINRSEINIITVEDPVEYRLTGLNQVQINPRAGLTFAAALAQRLTRKLCTHCCEMYTPTIDDLIKARISPEVAAAADGVVFYRKKGCPRCGQTGYKGRVGVFQLLVMSENLESLAARNASREELERAAIEEGMRTLWDDGLAKVAAGLTSIEELARVTT